jgi:NADH-quinone oxidoreductase subunit G
MADLVTLTIDGQEVQAPAGTLVINAAKSVGIEIPSFCYYEGLALQAACRMCLVEVEKAPKLMTSCTLPVREGMVVHTESPKVVTSRKAMLEFLLTNHPLDCPVCDKGGECELQDMVFRYGAGEGRYTEIKHHVEEEQFSPVVFYDAPRCILCYRCVRVCDEGLGVKALGVVNRGAVTEIAPNNDGRLDCDECGACIDICPVGALTSGIYRYQTRPWEMKHVGTICGHCSNGCKTTLGVRNNQIIRGNNRDRTGINGEFLCVKGRYAFDFTEHPERLRTPLLKGVSGFEPISWPTAINLAAQHLLDASRTGRPFGVIASTKTTNEENYYLRKLVRDGLGSNNIDHRRSGDLATLLRALNGCQEALASTADVYNASAVLVVEADLAQQHPLLAYQVRANWRHHQSRTYVVTPGPVREDQFAERSLRANAGEALAAVQTLSEELRRAPDLTVLIGAGVAGRALREFVEFAESLAIPVKYVCLMDCANSRGALDMGLTPAAGNGMSLHDMLAEVDLNLLWVVGANPLRRTKRASSKSFVIVQDLFLTETAQNANLVLPVASAYEKTGTITNVCGEVQKLHRALDVMGVKTDLEIFALLAREMSLDFGSATPAVLLDQIRKTVPGYDVSLSVLATGGAVQTSPPIENLAPPEVEERIEPSGDTLFTSGTLGKYSKVLNSLIESPGGLYKSGPR